MANILYEMTIENELTDFISAISLVDSPAIGEDFILLSTIDDKMVIDIKLEKITDSMRQVVTGAVLIPDLVIARDGYDIVFSKETVRKLSENYLMNGNKDNVTLQHKQPINKVKMIESWIVEDTKTDKSAKLGMSLPVGTWCASFKVQDQALWAEYLTSGVLKGFSLEGSFAQKEVKMHEHSENCTCHLDTEFEEYLSDWSDEDKDLYDIYTMLSKTEKNEQTGTTFFDVAEFDKLYVWKTSSGDEKCPVCERNSNRVFTLKQWSQVGIPRVSDGTKIGEGLFTNYRHKKIGVGDKFATYCETFCKCHLERIPDKAQPNTNPSKVNIPSIWKAIWKNIAPTSKAKVNPDYNPLKPVTPKNQPFK